MSQKVTVRARSSPPKNSLRQETMFDDPIVEEIRRVRYAHASQFDNDLSAIVEDLRRLERENGRGYVSFPPRRLEENQPEPKGRRPARRRYD